MTATTLHTAAIPPVRRALVNLRGCLAKTADHFAAQGTAEADWLDGRLAPDMFALTRQIQTASDAAKNLAARLSGGEAPSMPDTESGAAELLDRLDRTIAYLDSVPPSAIDGREDVEIVLKLPTITLRFTGASYVRDFGLPNFFFHAVTAYGIMRHLGAPIGKLDYLGPMDLTRPG
ncbi:hypothetical protein ASE00_17505 [Sphingomonas sp. Root710]|uniref:DUF1993 domain-containing protein n=1 Tax=Sphingomonas sp. Root710 TaxID=1736594 RepID=UPI0006FCEAB4|nr:DUF1993 domain-containing protein [Sphingomonas sp. Root710]KRB80976.1 hypothetical protein ASE00_17505 [Sphingomonas sp. Root710]